jgi:hypothetical protein
MHKDRRRRESAVSTGCWSASLENRKAPDEGAWLVVEVSIWGGDQWPQPGSISAALTGWTLMSYQKRKLAFMSPFGWRPNWSTKTKVTKSTYSSKGMLRIRSRVDGLLMVGFLLGFLGPHRAAFVAKIGLRRNSLPHPEGRNEVKDGEGRLSWCERKVEDRGRKSGSAIAAGDADARLALDRRPASVWFVRKRKADMGSTNPKSEYPFECARLPKSEPDGTALTTPDKKPLPQV